MQFPNDFIQARDCLITSKTFTEVTEYGMNTQVAKRGNPHKWLLDFTTRLLTDLRSRELSAFLDGLDGRYETFTLPCPLPFLGVSRSFSVGNGVYAGSNTIEVKGLPANTVLALVAGDFINFNNHTKTYKILKNVTSNVSGHAFMTIHPRLQTWVSTNELIVEGVFSLRMTKDTSGLSLSGSKSHTPIKFSAIEA